MPYAQSHYPFENIDRFEKSYPADFVSEGIDQTRGWFYTLLVLGTHLFDTAPWKNLIVTGLVLASYVPSIPLLLHYSLERRNDIAKPSESMRGLTVELTHRDGKKMSKKLKNYPDPMDIVGKYGADCVRLFLLNSPVVRGENLRFREEGVRDILTNVILKWINSLNFYLGQVELFDHEGGKMEPKRAGFMYEHDAKKSGNVMDRWVLARCQTLIQHVDQEMSGMSLYFVCRLGTWRSSVCDR
jgi:isoleucyl-tRNA synthetase